MCWHHSLHAAGLTSPMQGPSVALPRCWGRGSWGLAQCPFHPLQGPPGERGGNLCLPPLCSNLQAQAWAQSRCRDILSGGRQSVVSATSLGYSENGPPKKAIWSYLVMLKIFFF